jgi:SulP family sulfate permease
VALCISKPMITLSDWGLLWNEHEAILALPGLLAGLLLTVVSRTVQNDAALPLLMVIIPALFYIILFCLGMDLDDARAYGWVGEVSPPVPASDLFTLIDFSKVHWKLALDCVSTWLGMVFVVSFSSCLDVAAISMDMGEVLDVNTELKTVGISNTISGLFVGFTGSYIFSQTIFTCRTGTNSRWIGVFVAVSEIAVILSTVNVLQVVPLFFLGSTLIFIGIDLMYEWLFEVRHKILLSEYFVLILTFISIQLLGINFGIVLGVIIAVVDYVFMTARDSSVSKVLKRSRAVWKPDEWKLLKNHGYHIQNPKIVTFELKGTVFFGSSLQLLTSLSEELSLSASAEDMKLVAMVSPGPHRATASPSVQQTLKAMKDQRRSTTQPKPARVTRPRFVVFDLSQVPNIDSSAARGCFYQLAKICSRHNVVLCASGASPRVDWVLRSHEAAYAQEDEAEAKIKAANHFEVTDKIILFETVYEALEFCESNLISQLQPSRAAMPLSSGGSLLTASLTPVVESRTSLKEAFVNILGLKEYEEAKLVAFEKVRGPFHDEVEYHAGEAIFQEDSPSDGFFVVLSGSVALFRKSARSLSDPNFMSGAGSVRNTTRNTQLGDVETFIPAGGIFGFCDYVLDQPWLFSAVAAKDKTVVAKLHREGLMKLKAESPELDHIVDRVLLQVSILELANAQDL